MRVNRGRAELQAAALAYLQLIALGVDAQAQQARDCGNREPIDRLDQLGPALYACWKPPAGMEGRAITLRFSVRRDGTLMGKPQATFSKMTDKGADDQRFVASVLEALDKALPLPLTPKFGGIVAGRPMTLRFLAEPGQGI